MREPLIYPRLLCRGEANFYIRGTRRRKRNKKKHPIFTILAYTVYLFEDRY